MQMFVLEYILFQSINTNSRVLTNYMVRTKSVVGKEVKKFRIYNTTW